MYLWFYRNLYKFWIRLSDILFSVKLWYFIYKKSCYEKKFFKFLFCLDCFIMYMDGFDIRYFFNYVVILSWFYYIFVLWMKFGL